MTKYSSRFSSLHRKFLAKAKHFNANTFKNVRFTIHQLTRENSLSALSKFHPASFIIAPTIINFICIYLAWKVSIYFFLFVSFCQYLELQMENRFSLHPFGLVKFLFILFFFPSSVRVYSNIKRCSRYCTTIPNGKNCSSSFFDSTINVFYSTFTCPFSIMLFNRILACFVSPCHISMRALRDRSIHTNTIRSRSTFLMRPIVAVFELTNFSISKNGTQWQSFQMNIRQHFKYKTYDRCLRYFTLYYCDFQSSRTMDGFNEK